MINSAAAPAVVVRTPEFEDTFRIEIVPTGLDRLDGTQFRNNVRNVLKRIYSVDSGKMLLESLRGTGKRTEIHPYDGSLGVCNARFDSRNEPSYGRVLFTPTQPSSSCAPLLKDPTTNRGRLSHELLFHELVHSLSVLTNGSWNHGMISTGHKMYGNHEEFYAVVITNIFISDPSNKLEKSGLRADWKTWAPLRGHLADSFGFFASGQGTALLIDLMIGKMKDFCGKLAGIKAHFNPIAAYKQNPDKAREISLSAMSADMDKDDAKADAAMRGVPPPGAPAKK